jgi:predicted metal-binding membrane protein
MAMLVMWWVMMAAMMLPSATQMILVFATVNRKRRARGAGHVGTAVFGAGYLIAWGGFSLLATVAQWGLEQMALLTPMMTTGSPVFGGLLLIAAGIYQFTPLKHACLHHCRSPFDFVINRWREGRGGAVSMGLEHGLFCLGCCWMTMALLFVFGVMNLLWIAALSVLVLVEKAVPGGVWFARAGGLAMVAAGLVLLVAPELFGMPA